MEVTDLGVGQRSGVDPNVVDSLEFPITVVLNYAEHELRIVNRDVSREICYPDPAPVDVEPEFAVSGIIDASVVVAIVERVALVGDGEIAVPSTLENTPLLTAAPSPVTPPIIAM